MARKCKFMLERTPERVRRCHAPGAQKAGCIWLCDRHYHTVTIGRVPIDIGERDTYFDTLPGYEKMVYGHGLAREQD